MKAAPWKIIHIDLQQDFPALNPDPIVQGLYLVFWWENLPLGQKKVPREYLPLTVNQVKNMALKAIAPAVRAHLAEQVWNLPISELPDLHALVNLDRPLAQLQSNAATVQNSISVVICTRDRPDHLAACLQSLQQSSQQPDEIIIVDNAPQSQATYQLVANQPNIRYVLEPRPGLSIARNTGIAHSTSNIIAFTDDDVQVHSNWIQQLQQSFRHPEVMAVTGLVIPSELETESQLIFEEHWGFGQGFKPKRFGTEFFEKYRSQGVPVWKIGAGANMAFKRQVFEKVGQFDERLGAGASGCSEDSEFWYRILAQGWQCAYEPTAVVYHTHRRSFQSLNQQVYAYMRGHVAALLVQFENHRDFGNLWRLFLQLPKYYLRLCLSILKRGITPRHRTILTEILGCFSGIWFYFSNRSDQKV